jgi:hypothetical protein
MDDEQGSELKRRDFLRRAAATGAAAAFAAPVIQTVAATPAFAQENGSPVDGGCFHSTGTNGGCMPACADLAGCTGNQCGGQATPNNLAGPCTLYCTPGQGGGNPCCNPGLCIPGNFVCSTDRHGVATYNGSLAGCLT